MTDDTVSCTAAAAKTRNGGTYPACERCGRTVAKRGHIWHVGTHWYCSRCLLVVDPP